MDRSHFDGDQALATRDAVAGKGKRKRRRRTTQAATVRRINAKARERQEIRSEGQPLGYTDCRPPIFSEEELRARDVTRGLRSDRLSGEIAGEYGSPWELRAGGPS